MRDDPGKERKSVSKNTLERVLALLAFLFSSLWAFFWEFVRTIIYERLSLVLAPYIDLLSLDRLLHWGPSLVLAIIGGWLFWNTREKPSQPNSGSVHRSYAKLRWDFSNPLTIVIGLGAYIIILVGTAIFLAERRDARNITDKEIGIMAQRLEQRHPPSTIIKIACVFNDPLSCQYAARWAMLFETAHWTHTSVVPAQESVNGIRIYISDPSVDGYYDVITTLGVIAIKPDVYVGPYVDANQIEIFIGNAS